ncbi:3-oxo-tetronate kinase [Pseudomonas japonica]|uniref:3-oxo-tetronate kinase n=1 Tax=Pseudomonas japonica TaxID=256466 RepID=UPI0015E474B0|nr:3-oxo-tetronate kinase [Pseudomonas japonica]MBA1287463.1 four-carbon acid sugar kinase family protein [Pseudomonas japonica]
MNPARPLLGCIADDFTGATDLANILVRNGMRTVQTIGIPDAATAADLTADAIVVALKSRTIAPADAVRESLAALAWLKAQGCEQFFFKYCSTFDSTPKGNIGPVTEALQAALGVPLTIACPAFPEAGRTLFRGHLFVNDGLLNESGMEHHPLTPMTDANLVRVLQSQSQNKVGLLRYDQVAAGPEATRARLVALREQGVGIAIADAVSDEDLQTLGAACADLPLITGGSGVAQGLPGNFRKRGLLVEGNASSLPVIDGPAVVLAGSASRATNGQVAAWLEAGRPGYRIDPLRLAKGEAVVEEALAFSDRAEPVLIYATSDPATVKAVQAELGVERAGALVEEALGTLAKKLYERGTRRFVVAGGETSGAVVQALGVTALRIGGQIDPGVPVTVALGLAEPLGLTLKSGNFGSVDFFTKALLRLAGDWQ